jgi:PAS domain S-box-containing protein
VKTPRLYQISTKSHLIAILCFLLVVDALALFTTSWLDYKRSYERAQGVLQKTAISLEERVRRTVTASEAVLGGVAERIQEKGIDEVASSRGEWERLRRAANGLPDVGSLWLLNDRADLLIDSTMYPSQRMNFSEREYFVPQRDQAIKTYLGPVVKGKITRKYSFTISRRLDRKDGTFAGIVLAALDTDDFTHFLNYIDAGPGAAITVFRTDGALILRQPMDDGYVGKQYRRMKLFAMIGKAPSGTYETKDTMDGLRRVISYRKMDGLPLVVVTSIPADSIIGPWRHRVEIYVLISALVLCGLVGLSWLVYKSTSREEEARRALQELLSTLETKIAERTSELSETNRSLQTAIAEREKAFHDLKETELKASALLNAAGESIWLFGPDDTILAANTTAASRLGMDVTSIVGRKWTDLVPPPLIESRRKALDEVLSTGRTINFQDERAGIFFDHTFYPVLDANAAVVGVASFSQDVTVRKRAEIALQQSEQRWATTLASIGDAVIATDPEGNIVFMNTVAEELTGWTLSEATMAPSSTVFHIVNEATRAEVESPVTLVIREGLIVGLANHTILIRKDGSEVPIDDSGAPIKDTDGKTTGVVLVFRDITERKAAEKALQAAHDELEFRVRERTAELRRQAELLELAYNAIIVRDLDERITFWNARAEEIYGFTKAEALGSVSHSLLDTKFPVPFDEYMSALTKEGRWEGELVHTTKEGRRITVLSRHALQRDEAGNHLAIMEINMDVTASRELEAQLRQAQKMEALGTLSGGIAHDFNNMLASIIGFGELIKGHVPKESREHRHVQRILDAGIRGRELVKQMLTFSRQTEQEKKPLQLSSIVAESTKLLRASIPSTVSIRTNVKSESGLILGDPTQTQQIIMNLATNAAYAMREKGGTLDIELSDFSVGHNNSHAMQPGLYMKLTVRDTGTGIRPEIVDRIFDPFFTTKGVGEGTGLGLSVVLGIVKQAGGHITVVSEPGNGSTFDVYFPKATDRLGTEVSTDEATVPGGNEKVLFVDDEEALVEMGEELLSELGYNVTCCTSSAEALARFSRDPSEFNLVITDQTMPDMTGVQLAAELLAIRPVPVILCTGFSHTANEESARTAGIKGFVMKPLTKREIAKAIRKMLDG